MVVLHRDRAGEQKPPDDPVEIDQKKLIFVPHVQPIVKGTKVMFENGDPLLHNVFWNASDDGSYPAKNLGTWGQGDTKTYTFDKLGYVGLALQHPSGDGRLYPGLAESLLCGRRQGRHVRN